VGIGAIGRQVAQLITAMGAKRVCLVDPDTVGVENLAVQGYCPTDIGIEKVTAASAALKQINPEIDIITHNRQYGGDIDPMVGSDVGELAVFCCVDSIEARKFIWNTLFQSTHTKNMDLWVDGRMAAETLRVFTWKKGAAKKKYEETLFPASEAFQASCTGRSTLYSSYVVAGLMVGEFVKHLRNQPITGSQTFNLLASDHSVND
jgi:hypothetical protein